MSFKKKINSNIIAAIATLAIHTALIIALSVNFGSMSSSAQGDNDDELMLQLEDLLAEDFEITPAGNNSERTNENESIQGSENENGTVKQQVTDVSQEPEARIVAQEIPDTLPIIKKTIAKLEVDSVIPTGLDSAIVQITRQAHQSVKRNNGSTVAMSHKERLEFYKKNYRLIRNFKKVYPYALNTRSIIENLNAKLAATNSESEKKKMIRETEQMLFREYESAVRTMSTSQGKLLLKLIARETNKTGYEIIKDYKGAFSATFWYSVGKIFNTDLKTQYDKEQQEDSLIEDVLNKYNQNDLY